MIRRAIVCHPAARCRLKIGWRSGNGGVQCYERFILLPQLAKGSREDRIRSRETGKVPDCASCYRRRPQVVALEVTANAEKMHRRRSCRSARIKPQRDGERFPCFSCHSGKHQETPARHLCPWIIGVEADRNLRLVQGRTQLALVIECPCQHRMTHSIVWVQFDGGPRRGFCQFDALRQRSANAECRLRKEEPRQHRVRLAEPWIERGCLLQEFPRGTKVFAALFGPVPERPLIGFPGAKLLGRPFHGTLSFGMGDRRRQRCNYRLRDFILYREEAGQVAIESFRPDVAAGLGIDELGHDADAALVAADTALDEVAHTKFLPDLSYVGRPPLVREARIARDVEDRAIARLYIHLARDGRDALMSMHNHFTAFSDERRAGFDRIGLEDPAIGMPYPRLPADPAEYFRQWMTTPVVAGQTEGTPLPSFFDLEVGFWAERRRPNLLLVHYNDLQENLDAEMRRISAFIGLEVNEAVWPALVSAAGFAAMQDASDRLMPHLRTGFAEGAKRFFHKGTNGRWRNALSCDDLALYDAKVSQKFSAGLAAWVECGTRATSDPRETVD
jgi:hypothetical protein